VSKLLGYVGDGPDGRIRLYREEDPTTYVDLSEDAVVGAKAGESGLALELTVDDDAAIIEGRLDRTAFDELFEIEGKPRPYVTFYCTTKFWHCKYTKQIC